MMRPDQLQKALDLVVELNNARKYRDMLENLDGDYVPISWGGYCANVLRVDTITAIKLRIDVIMRMLYEMHVDATEIITDPTEISA